MVEPLTLVETLGRRVVVLDTFPDKQLAGANYSAVTPSVFDLA
jgi:hypothetical protein